MATAAAAAATTMATVERTRGMSRTARLSATESVHTTLDGSWHADYKDSAYIYIGGLDPDLTEGDVIAVFSQCGEVLDINLVRDRTTGRSRGFCFLKYEDQRSTILAVDNLSGATVVGRKLRVDHVRSYTQPVPEEPLSKEEERRIGMNVAPEALIQEMYGEFDETDVEENTKAGSDEEYARDLDLNDPMRDYIIQQRREAKRTSKS